MPVYVTGFMRPLPRVLYPPFMWLSKAKKEAAKPPPAPAAKTAESDEECPSLI